MRQPLAEAAFSAEGTRISLAPSGTAFDGHRTSITSIRRRRNGLQLRQETKLPELIPNEKGAGGRLFLYWFLQALADVRCRRRVVLVVEQNLDRFRCVLENRHIVPAAIGVDADHGIRAADRRLDARERFGLARLMAE